MAPQPAQPALLATGVPSFDTLLGGGIPARQSIIITGDPGTGKTILCSQIAFSVAARGKQVVIATVTSEPHDKLLEELRGFSFFDASQIGESIYFVSAYAWLQKGPKEAKEMLVRTMRERKGDVLFVDGLRSIRDLWQNESKLRDFLYELNVFLAQMGAICLFTTEYPLATLVGYPEATTVDGIVSLSTVTRGERLVRRVQVAKLRGRPHMTGQHLMHITEDGVTVVPRIECVVSADAAFQPTGERAAFGLPELDAMLDGGLPRASATLVAGSTGIGKTFLSLHFAAEGARAGEDVLFVTYSEPPARLLDRSRRIGLDVAPLVASGKLVIDYRSTVGLEGDDLALHIMEHVRRRRTGRVIIDGIGELEHSIFDKTRSRDFLESLIIFLRDAGVTSIFIREVSKLAGPDLDFSDAPIAVTAENMLFLRHLEMNGRLHRIMSILKMRESRYDQSLREFELTSSGLRVLEPIQSVEGLLTGIGRVIGRPAPAGG